jgi:hypothetical protein
MSGQIPGQLICDTFEKSPPSFDFVDNKFDPPLFGSPMEKIFIGNKVGTYCWCHICLFSREMS